MKFVWERGISRLRDQRRYISMLAYIMTVVLLAQSAIAMERPVNLNCTAVDPSVSTPIVKFLQTISPSDVQTDPSQLSILIAVALNQRYGRHFRMSDIAGMIEPSDIGSHHSFFEIKQIIQKAGYATTAFQIKGDVNAIHKDDVGFLIDQSILPHSRVIALLFASTDERKYLLYAGFICPMTQGQFEKRFADSAFLKLNQVVPSPPSTSDLITTYRDKP